VDIEEGGPFCCGTLSLLFTLAILAGPNSAVAQARLRSKLTNVTVTISPPKATLFAGEKQAFMATVVGEGDRTVTWSVDEEDGGTVTNWGLYTAPKIQGLYHVTATSTANPQKAAVMNHLVRSRIADAIGLDVRDESASRRMPGPGKR